MAGSRHRAPRLLSLVILTSVAGGAAAGRTVYQRPAPARPPVTLSERARPPRPRTTPPPRPVSADDLLAAQGKVAPIRKAQMALYRQLIDDPASTVTANERADLHARLAELYLQDDRYHRLKGTEAAIAADRAAGADRTRLRGEATRHARAGAADRREALAVYRALIDDDRFRGYPRMDAALAAYATTLAADGDGAAGRDAWKRLLDQHPQSPYVPDAYLAFADYYFDTDELDNAAAFYDKVLQFPQARAYQLAAYRRGWVDLNQRRPDDAPPRFLAVARDTAGDARQAALHGAAERDFVRAYAEFGKVQLAWAALAKLDADRAPALYATLADLYLEQGKVEPAIYALRQLIAKAPGDPAVCRWQADVARATLALPGATVDDRAAEIVRVARLYGALAGRGGLPADALAACKDDAAALTGELARAWHAEGAKAKDPALLAAADALYDAYLAQFAAAADAGETAYYRAELAWLRADLEPDARARTQRWQDAGAQFTAVVRAGAVTPHLRQVSADAAVRAYKNALDVDPRPTLPPPATAAGAAVPPQPIPPLEQALLAAMDDYVRYVDVPGDPDRVGMIFLGGEVYRRHHHDDLAIARYVDVIEHHPEHETAYYAANLLLDVLVLAGKDAEVERWTGYFAAHPEFLAAGGDQDRAPLGKRIADYQVIAGRHKAEALERAAQASGDLATYVECGRAYLDLFNRDPEVAHADQLLWNAGVCFEHGRSLSTAIEAFTELRERFPASPEAARALARLGAAYAQVAYYDRAATMYEEYARRYGKERDADDLMNDAVFYRKGTGDDAAAIADTRYYIATFARDRPAVAADAFFGLAAVIEKRGDADAAIAHYRAYLDRYGARGGARLQLAAQARLGQLLWDSACPAATVDGACVKAHRERAVARRGRLARVGTRTQCGDDTRTQVAAVARDPRRVKQARAALAAAIATYETGAGRFGDGEAVARHWYAQARFLRAEMDHEAYLALAFPAGLDFDPRKPAVAARSMQRFEAWYRAKQGLAGTLGTEYAALVKQVRDPAVAIAAAARFGEVQEQFADALYTAEIPPELRPYDEAVDAYCGALEDKAAPHAEAALVGFEKCLQASTDFGWFSSWSALCERELGQLAPERYPAAGEVHAAPDAAVAVADVEPAAPQLR